MSHFVWAEALMRLYQDLQPPPHLPNGIQWLYPQQQAPVQEVMQIFFNRFFNDGVPRRLILGINPGRFGAGATGVNFTATKQLQQFCGIDTALPQQSELSAEFIYQMIEAYGGPARFYKDFFIGAVCPLGFVQAGKNINYYDDKALLQQVTPFITHSIQQLVTLPFDRRKVFCVGGEKNYKHLLRWNNQHQWFNTVVPLPHPRFVMQYRRRFVADYINQYLQAFAD